MVYQGEQALGWAGERKTKFKNLTKRFSTERKRGCGLINA